MGLLLGFLRLFKEGGIHQDLHVRTCKLTYYFNLWDYLRIMFPQELTVKITYSSTRITSSPTAHPLSKT